MDKAHKKHFIGILSFFFLLEQLSMSQTIHAEKEADKIAIHPFLNVQLWGLNQHYTTEEQEIDQTLILFRRGRFGANTSIGNRWKMQIQIAMDGLGLTSTDTTKQSVQYQNTLNIWSAQVQYKVFAQSEALYLNMGYMLPHISHESVTSPWSVASLDKMRSSVALRYFVTGKTNGISMGLTAGGLVLHKKVYYSVAIMPNTFYIANQAQTQSPLLMGHVLFSVFGNEFNKYRFALPASGYKQHTGISVGFGGSHQGNTPVFQSNSTLGIHLLMAFKGFLLDAEYYKLLRNNDGKMHDGYTYHLRGTYTRQLKTAQLQTTIAFWENNGDVDLYKTSVYKENAWDAGIDYIPKQKPIKIGIHYTYSMAKNKFTYAPGIQTGKYVHAIILKLQATIH